jgi:hypothetical protein
MIELRSARIAVLAEPARGLAVDSIVDRASGSQALGAEWHVSVLGETPRGWTQRGRSESSAAASATLGVLRLDRWIRVGDREVSLRTTVHNTGVVEFGGAFVERLRLVPDAATERGDSGYEGLIGPGRSVTWELTVAFGPVDARSTSSGR